MTTIGEGAFNYCTSLEEIYFLGSTLPSIGEDNFGQDIPNDDVTYYVTNEGMKDALMSTYGIPEERIEILESPKKYLNESGITWKTPTNATTRTQPEVGFITYTDDMPEGNYTVVYTVYDSKSKLLETATDSFTLPLPDDELDMTFLSSKKFMGDGTVMEKLVITRESDDYKATFTNKFNISSVGSGDIDPLQRGVYAIEK